MNGHNLYQDEFFEQEVASNKLGWRIWTDVDIQINKQISLLSHKVNPASLIFWTDSHIRSLAAKTGHKSGVEKDEAGEEERWNEENPAPLVGILKGVFSRLVEEKKIVGYFESGEETPNLIAMNTGLQGTDRLDQIAIFTRGNNPYIYALARVVNAAEIKTGSLFQKPALSFLPPPADFFSGVKSINSLAFNPHYKIDTTFWHCGNSVDRIIQDHVKEDQRVNPSGFNPAMKNALEEVEARLRRCFRLAVPYYHREKGAAFGVIRLLVPLKVYTVNDLTNQTVNCVGSIEFDHPSKQYQLHNLIDTFTAHTTARLLAKIDQRWLQDLRGDQATKSEEPEGLENHHEQQQQQQQQQQQFPQDHRESSLNRFFPQMQSTPPQPYQPMQPFPQPPLQQAFQPFQPFQHYQPFHPPFQGFQQFQRYQTFPLDQNSKSQPPPPSNPMNFQNGPEPQQNNVQNNVHPNPNPSSSAAHNRSTQNGHHENVSHADHNNNVSNPLANNSEQQQQTGKPIQPNLSSLEKLKPSNNSNHPNPSSLESNPQPIPLTNSSSLTSSSVTSSTKALQQQQQQQQQQPHQIQQSKPSPPTTQQSHQQSHIGVSQSPPSHHLALPPHSNQNSSPHRSLRPPQPPLNAGLPLPRSSQPPIHLNYSLPPRPPGPIRSHFEQDADPTKLYVKNLDFATTKNELMSYFGCSDAQIFMKQGRHMGMASVQFDDAESAEEAIRKFNDSLFKGRKISVTPFDRNSK